MSRPRPFCEKHPDADSDSCMVCLACDEEQREAVAALAIVQAESNGYAQQAGALRRERDEARQSRDAMADECATLRADLDLHKAALAEAQRVRDECAAETLRLREAATALDPANPRRSDCNDRKCGECVTCRARAALAAPSRAAEVLAGIEQRARADERAKYGGWIPQADAQAACEVARSQARAAALEEAATWLDKRSLELRGELLPQGAQLQRAAWSIRRLAKPRDPDSKPREAGCKCHLEEGDSPCPVHDRVEVVKFAPPASVEAPDAKRYPCDDCGALRTKAEGGTTFTVCDACWDKAHPPVANAPCPANVDGGHHAWNNDGPCTFCKCGREIT